MKGYAHRDYAQSLLGIGTPRELSRCGGWIIERPIPGTPYRDAMGCYPLFCCDDWASLPSELDALGGDLVSLALVTDPFGRFDIADLNRSFDVVIPFKDHYVADLQCSLNEIAGKRHRKNARRALRDVEVRTCDDPTQFLDEWITLYGNLIERHNISGIQAFSREAFARQLCIPGTHLLRAVHGGTTVGAQIYFVQGDVAHCHLGAVSPAGYDLGAFFALDFHSLEYFSHKVRWLNLGGGAGVKSDAADGLSAYKRGWASETRTCYFCGKIFNREIYAELTRQRGKEATDYFPAYRQGEFG